ncbi:MAG TPA: rod shape-determining protein MreD [Bacteroidales bacterium]|nr:rod shape-determining protein MreD [Bacteroidales bacterium]HPS17633.1 rod shape-determining protein MreD [Bacteroidales bacterium]
MINIVSRNILRFIFLVLFQVIILNSINLGGYINPYFYVLFILMLPFETPKWLLLISSFFLGFSIDIFSDTPGLHSAACVFMAYMRPYILGVVTSKQEYELGIQPNIRDLGFRWFFSYSLILVSIHHLILFYLEVFSFQEFFQTLLRTFLSIAFTVFLLILSQYILYRPKK